MKNTNIKAYLSGVLIYTFICVFLISEIVFMLFVLNYQNQKLQIEAEEICNTRINQVSNILSGIEKTAESIATNIVVQKSLLEYTSLNENVIYDMENNINKALIFSDFGNLENIDIAIIGFNGVKYDKDYHSFRKEYFYNEEWFNDILKSNDTYWSNSHIGRYANVSQDEYYITCAKKIINYQKGEILGLVLVDIKTDGLTKILEKNENDNIKDFIISNNEILMKNLSYTINYLEFISINDIDNGDKIDIIANQQTISGYGFVENINFGDLKYFAIIHQEYFGSLLKEHIVFSVVLLGIWISFCFLMLRDIDKLLIKPISILREKMINIQNKSEDKKTDYDSVAFLEVEELFSAFEDMTNENIKLINEAKKKNEELYKTKMSLLFAQINPHFLYNTLETVLWLNRDGKRSDIEVAVSSLANFLKIGVSRGKEIISLKQELNHLESYLKIQSIRYKDKMTYNINIQNNIEHILIPKMTLQPFAENALYHGIRPLDEIGLINVDVSMEGENIIIVMKDTGIGMKEDRLHYVQNVIDGIEENDNSVYGIKNVIDRLKIFYNDVSIKFYSQYYEGTSVTIVISNYREGDESNLESINC